MAEPTKKQVLGIFSLCCGSAGLVMPPLLAVVTIIVTETVTRGGPVPGVVEKSLFAAMLVLFVGLELIAGLGVESRWQLSLNPATIPLG